MPARNDSELVQLCRRGNHRAFRGLFDKYHTRVLGIALKMVRDYDDARDVAQTVFVKAFEKLDSFKPELSFSSWICKIAVNESINLIEKRKNTVALTGAHPVTDNSPDKAYQRSQLADRVDEAIMEMAVTSRALIVLRHFADLSYQELSYVFDTPEKTIKSRLHEARRSLSRILEKRGVAVQS